MCNSSTPMLVGRTCIYRLLKVCLWMDLALICVLIHPWDNLGIFFVLISATFTPLAKIYRLYCLFCEQSSILACFAKMP